MGDNDVEFLQHEGCPSCGSRDNLARYTDGHGYCFGCGYYEPGQEQAHHVRPKMSNFVVTGEAVNLPGRKIDQEVCAKYRAYVDGKTIRFHYCDSSGRPTGAKVRDSKKNFTFEGSNPDDMLYGQSLFPNSGRRVVITEGEFDALSCYQAMPGWPMVSVPSGAKSAKNAIKKQLEWLQGYEEVVIFFDNDDVGIEAAKETAQVLPPGQVKIASLETKYKDASDALQAGDADAIRKAIWNAKEFRPDGIIEGRSCFDLICKPEASAIHEWPYQGLQKKLHGIRPRELYTITAGSGIGKSTFCRGLATHLLSSGERVGYLALEESVRSTALGLMSLYAGEPLHLTDPSIERLLEIHKETLAKWNLYLFDGFGSYDPDIIYNRIEYLASGLDVKVVFLDHLSILLSGLDGDERRTIDITMTRLRSLVERTNITLFLVCHVSGDDNGKPYEEGGRIKMNKLRGSRSIGQLSDGVIALERDQQSEEGEDLTAVRVLKNRFSGETGVACSLRYDQSTGNYVEVDETEMF